MKPTDKQFLAGAWAVTGTLCLLAILAVGQRLDWSAAKLDSYQLFPLLGLLAYSIFLSHYIVGTVREILGIKKSVIKDFFSITSWAALAIVVAHPSLLVVQLWLDGFGLPPGSYLENYVAPTLKWATFLGVIGLLMFLSYELTKFRRFKKWVPYLQMISDIAMIMIFIHGLSLGLHLQRGWFRYVWLAYGLILLICLSYAYIGKVRVKLKGE